MRRASGGAGEAEAIAAAAAEGRRADVAVAALEFKNVGDPSGTGGLAGVILVPLPDSVGHA